MTQEEWARAINFSPTHVSSVETRHRPPTAEYVAAIDNAFGTGGTYSRLLAKLTSFDAAPIWLRDWIEIEREAVLRRPVPEHPGLMREQVERIISLAELDHVQVQVVPATTGLYLGLAGQLILADLSDNSRLGHADNQLKAQLVVRPVRREPLTPPSSTEPASSAAAVPTRVRRQPRLCDRLAFAIVATARIARCPNH